jgi:RND superfamily putative drug exporter
MRRRSSIFAAVVGPRAKWIVFAVWLAVIFGSFAAGVPEKYTNAQENESTSFLPGDAESTKALTAAEELQGGLSPRGRADGGRQAADRRRRRAADVAALPRRRC